MDKSNIGNLSPFNVYGSRCMPLIGNLSPAFDLAGNISAQDCDFEKHLRTAAPVKKTGKQTRYKSKSDIRQGKIKRQSNKRANRKSTATRCRSSSVSSNEEAASDYEQSGNSRKRKLKKTSSKSSVSGKAILEPQEGNFDVSKTKVDPFAAIKSRNKSRDDSAKSNIPAVKITVRKSAAAKSMKLNSPVHDSLPCGESGKWKYIRMYQERNRKRELRKKRERQRKRSQGRKTSKRKKSRKRGKSTKRKKSGAKRRRSKKRNRSTGTRKRSTTRKASTTRRRKKASKSKRRAAKSVTRRRRRT